MLYKHTALRLEKCDPVVRIVLRVVAHLWLCRYAPCKSSNSRKPVPNKKAQDAKSVLMRLSAGLHKLIHNLLHASRGQRQGQGVLQRPDGQAR